MGERRSVVDCWSLSDAIADAGPPALGKFVCGSVPTIEYVACLLVLSIHLNYL